MLRKFIFELYYKLNEYTGEFHQRAYFWLQKFIELGFIGVLFILFTPRVNKRDKVYSSLLGMAIGMLIIFYLLKLFGSVPRR